MVQFLEVDRRGYAFGLEDEGLGAAVYRTDKNQETFTRSLMEKEGRVMVLAYRDTHQKTRWLPTKAKIVNTV